MGATRTIGRALLVAACLALLSACQSRGKPAGHRAPAQAPRGTASAAWLGTSAEKPNPIATPIPSALPSAVVQTLRSLREQRLEIAPSATPSERLAFGTGRLLQASLDKATFRDSQQGQVITESSIGAVRAVAHGSDGSLFAIGASGGARLEPRKKEAKPFAQVTFLPGSVLFPDLEQASHFFVYYPVAEQLHAYAFASEAFSLLPIEASFHLPACREPIAQLRDNAIVCRTASGFLRQAPRGSRAEFSFPESGDPPIRLLPGKRIDEFFAVSKAGEVSHLRLAERLVVVARFRLPAPAYAASANTEALAFVLLAPALPGQARRWSLRVTDFAGQLRFESELPAQAPSAEEDWLPALVEDKNLAISGFEPLVAVGGASRVTVWDYARAREQFTR